VQTLQVQSKNVAPDGESIHRAMYQLVFDQQQLGTQPGASQSRAGAPDELSFGDMVASSATLRTFSIKNVTDGPITLKCSSSREGLKL
jgi:hypothetical protein